MEPTVGRYPIEVFGTLYTDVTAGAKDCRARQYCPYLDRECTKPRKSEPHIKVGICSVGYKGTFSQRHAPVIICPNRFLEETVFQSIHDLFFPSWEQTKWVKEVNMGVSGNVDYVALRADRADAPPEDFFCVEFQACGTTGSPYGYVRDLREQGAYTRSYTFGLNWANEFVKTMMQQVYKKGKVVSAWGRKIVFVIQDISMAYLQSAADTSGLRKHMDDPIHFMMYQEVWDDEAQRYRLVPADWLSAGLEGIDRILAGANAEQYLTAEQFLANAVNKGKSDGIL